MSATTSSAESRRRPRRGRYLFKQRLVRLRQIEGFHLGLPPAQISGGPIDLNHVAVRVVEIEGEGCVVVGRELDRDLPLHNARIERSELGERRDLKGDLGESRVGEQSYFVRLFIGTAAQKGARTERMVSSAPAYDVHAENIPVEFRRCRWVRGS